jgi:hypothetical protein
LHSRSRADVASLNAAWAAVTAGVTRDARVCVTSAMFTEAKPMPAVTAKTKVATQMSHPASAVARWRPSQSVGHDKSNEIRGHANGEKQPFRRFSFPRFKRARQRNHVLGTLLDLTTERAHHTDPRHHRRAAVLGHQHQRLYRDA